MFAATPPTNWADIAQLLTYVGDVMTENLAIVLPAVVGLFVLYFGPEIGIAALRGVKRKLVGWAGRLAKG